MAKIPLHNLFARLGIESITSKEELEAVIARMEAYAAANPDATIAEMVEAVATEIEAEREDAEEEEEE